MKTYFQDKLKVNIYSSRTEMIFETTPCPRTGSRWKNPSPGAVFSLRSSAMSLACTMISLSSASCRSARTMATMKNDDTATVSSIAAVNAANSRQKSRFFTAYFTSNL